MLATDYIVARKDQAERILAQGPEGHPHARLAGIDPGRLSTLLAILARRLRPYGGAARCRLLTDPTRDECVVLVPPRMVALLVAAAPLAGSAAVDWSKAHVGGLRAWTERDAAHALECLVELATIARRTNRDLLARLALSGHWSDPT